jgi:hypothetical protein
MNVDEVVVHEVERRRMGAVLGVLGEGVGKPGESAGVLRMLRFSRSP